MVALLVFSAVETESLIVGAALSHVDRKVQVAYASQVHDTIRGVIPALEYPMQFGERVRELRKLRGLTQQTVADRMNVSVSYISKVENEKLHFGDYPSEKFIHKLADELKADEDELLLLADKVPPAIRKRIRQRPELFRKLAGCSKKQLDELEHMMKTST